MIERSFWYLFLLTWQIEIIEYSRLELVIETVQGGVCDGFSEESNPDWNGGRKGNQQQQKQQLFLCFPFLLFSFLFFSFLILPDYCNVSKDDKSGQKEERNQSSKVPSQTFGENFSVFEQTLPRFLFFIFLHGSFSQEHFIVEKGFFSFLFLFSFFFFSFFLFLFLSIPFPLTFTLLFDHHHFNCYFNSKIYDFIWYVLFSRMETGVFSCLFVSLVNQNSAILIKSMLDFVDKHQIQEDGMPVDLKGCTLPVSHNCCWFAISLPLFFFWIWIVFEIKSILESHIRNHLPFHLLSQHSSSFATFLLSFSSFIVVITSDHTSLFLQVRSWSFSLFSVNWQTQSTEMIGNRYFLGLFPPFLLLFLQLSNSDWYLLLFLLLPFFSKISRSPFLPILGRERQWWEIDFPATRGITELDLFLGDLSFIYFDFFFIISFDFYFGILQTFLNEQFSHLIAIHTPTFFFQFSPEGT